MKRMIALLLPLTLALGACSGKKQEEAPKAEKPPAAVETMTAAPEALEEGIEVVGNLSAKQETTVRSELKTRIVKVFVTQWVSVAKGQPLAEMDTRDLLVSRERAKAAVEAAHAREAAAHAQEEAARAQQDSAKAALRRAEVDADRAEREQKRMENLFASGLATRQGLDDAQSALDAARAGALAAQSQIEAVKAQAAAAGADAKAAQAAVWAAREEEKQIGVALEKATVRAPISGVLAERMVNEGDMPGDGPLFRVVDPTLLNLTVSVPSQHIARLAVGQPLTFTTDAFPGEAFSGAVMFLNPSADAADRSLRVTAEVRNVPVRLKPGLFVKGRILTGQKPAALLVPRTALSTWDVEKAKAELLVVEGGRVRKKTVGTGSTRADRVEIVTGLAPGDKVVVRGGFTVKDGDAVTASGKEN